MRGNSPQRTIRLPKEATFVEGTYNLVITDDSTEIKMNMQNEYALNMQNDLKFLMDFFQSQAGKLKVKPDDQPRFRSIAAKLGENK